MGRVIGCLRLIDKGLIHIKARATFFALEELFWHAFFSST